MKTTFAVFSLFVVITLLTGCGFRIDARDINFIEPSDTIITEERQVSGFDSIEFSTFGRVILAQGETESLTIKGSDNIVPLVKTSVSGSILSIRMEEDINVTNMNSDNVLTFTITVKDLTKIAISGAGKVEMDRLDTNRLMVDLSGAGSFVLDAFTADRLDVIVSGVGNVEIAGEVDTAKIEISGAGPINCPDLKIRDADITISGIGSAKVWVTDQLTGEISGGGNVSYYGDPRANTQSTGIGVFTSLGDK